MQFIQKLFILLLFAGNGSLWAQTGKDCRIQTQDLKPVVAALNPFVAEHFWDNESKTEFVKLSAERSAILQQKGCLRHHIDIQVIITAAGLRNEPDFLVTELDQAMTVLFYESPDYQYFRTEFRKLLKEKFYQVGLRNQFNFIISERTFLVTFDLGEWGAKINCEVVRFIPSETIVRPGIEDHLDDGWFREQE